MAAGLGTPQLARMAGIDVPLDDKAATLNVYTVPAPPLLRHMLLSGGFLSVNCHQHLVTEQGYMGRKPKQPLLVPVLATVAGLDPGFLKIFTGKKACFLCSTTAINGSACGISSSQLWFHPARPQGNVKPVGGNILPFTVSLACRHFVPQTGQRWQHPDLGVPGCRDGKADGAC